MRAHHTLKGACRQPADLIWSQASGNYCSCTAKPALPSWGHNRENAIIGRLAGQLRLVAHGRPQCSSGKPGK
eukprot:6743301-Prymnesium_polylepis.1